MDLENTQNNSLAKLPLLKQCEYDTWRLRIESYIQLQDYALWEIIEEGNSFKPVARTTANEDGTSTTTIPGLVTDEQKILKKNDLKRTKHLITQDDSKVHLKQMYKPSMLLAQRHSSTNDVNTANVHVSTGSTPVSTASTNNSTACLKCRNPRSQENKNRSQDSSRRTVNVEESSSKAMLAIDGTRFNWSYMADEEASTNFALMAFSDSEALFAPLSIDLSNSGIEKFKQPEFEGYGFKVNKNTSENVSKEVKRTSDAPIIEDWVSDCDEDETVVLESLNVQKPKQADQPRKVNQNSRNNSTNWNTQMPKQLGVGFQFTPKACFVCGSFNHLIKDCDFHDKKMVQKPVLNNVKKGTGQREVRPVWTNAMRVNHQNFSNSRRNFAPTAVLTKSGLVPFSTARQNFSRKAAPVSAVRPFNTDVHKPFVNVVKTRTNVFQKSHSLLRRPFYQQSTLKNRNLNNKVNTAKVISVNTVRKQGINAIKPTAYWAWRPKIKMINHVYKNTGSCICKQFNYVDPTALTIPGQTTTGKESSNPFMAGSLPKTIREDRRLQMIHERSMTNFMLCLVLILLAKDSEVCKITRADGSSRFHGDIQALLRRLDRQDLRQLYSLVQERFKDHPLEGHDLDL
ncbi:hypothetical protein Tco_0111819 [Tanacetum coccineum]